MPKTTFEDDGLVDGRARLEAFAAALRPVLPTFGAAARVDVELGGLHGDLYTGATALDVLRGVDLVGPAGAPVELRIERLDVEGSHTEVRVRIEGEAADVDVLKAALTPVLRATFRKHADGR